jgi:hypothetical protein
MVEALIDFGEGEDIEEGVYDEGRTILLDILNSLLTGSEMRYNT